METAIVYMVAGLSSRFGGKIKQFARVGPKGETLIEYSLNQALKSGFTKIVFIVGNKTEQPFKEMFGNEYKGIPVFYALQNFDPAQRDKPWGTCDALCSATHLIKEPFVVFSGDDICGDTTFQILVNHLKTRDEEATIGKKLIELLPKQGNVNRGIFYVDNENNVTNMAETKEINQNNLEEKGLKKNDFASISIFALHPETLVLLNKRLENFKDKNKEDRGKECYLNLELSELIKSNQIKMKLYETPNNWFGVTNPEDEIKIREILKNKINE